MSFISIGTEETMEFDVNIVQYCFVWSCLSGLQYHYFSLSLSLSLSPTVYLFKLISFPLHISLYLSQPTMLVAVVLCLFRAHLHTPADCLGDSHAARDREDGGGGQRCVRAGRGHVSQGARTDRTAGVWFVCVFVTRYSCPLVLVLFATFYLCCCK